MQGTWVGVKEFSMNETSAPDAFNFTIEQETTPNYLMTIFGDEIVKINISTVDLSGNFTINENTYFFNLIQRAPPFVSSPIDLGEAGKLYCSFASYFCAHCIYLNPEGESTTYMFTKIVLPDLRPFYVKYSNLLLVVAVLAVMPFVFSFINKCMLSNFPPPPPRQPSADDKGEEKVEEGDKPKDEESKGETEEAPEQTETKELEPDEDGKYKTE